MNLAGGGDDGQPRAASKGLVGRGACWTTGSLRSRRLQRGRLLLLRMCLGPQPVSPKPEGCPGRPAGEPSYVVRCRTLSFGFFTATKGLMKPVCEALGTLPGLESLINHS